MADDDTVMRYCTEKLQNAINTDKNLIKKLNLTKRQLALIKKGSPRIDDFTWHHDPTVLGKMSLVKRDIHSKNKHTGGSTIWGGGKK